MKTLLFFLLLLQGALTMAHADAPTDTIPLRLTANQIHDAILQAGENGAYEIRTTGPDPYVFTEPVPADANRRVAHVLAFEYFSMTGTGAVQVFASPPLTEARSVTGEGLSHSEGWASYALDLTSALGGAEPNFKALRLDFGSAAGKVFQIRGLMLRPETEQERRLAVRRAAQRESEKQRDTRLRAYLQRSYPCRVTRVAVETGQVRIEGDVAGERGALFLAEAPIYADATDSAAFPFRIPIRPDARGHFAVTLPRQRGAGDAAWDRLLSRWAVVRRTGDKNTLLSSLRYADTIAARANLPEETPRNKKGIGALGPGRPLSDLDDLDIAAATVNIAISGLLSTTPAENRTPFSYGGRTWYADDGQVRRLDQTMLEAAKHHIVVSAIVLVPQAGDARPGDYSRLIAHPDADPAGIFAMPNVSDKDGLRAYAAALDFLASRYGRADNRYGRIHHWILHNEINAGWVWTNAGEKSALLYMDLYHRSMRTAHLIARQYDPHAQAFISLEHHWTAPPTPHFYAGRELLERLADFSQVEGDFPWAIAFHPYPQSLLNPRVWEDNEPTFTFDTPKITFKNLEVLDAWVRQPRMLYQGKPRVVHLTEQGLNSPNYSPASLRDQAAGMAYAWNKFKALDTIQVFDYHNWVDNRGEGGLRIGLRRFPDDADDPLGKKPIWFVYQALGTDREAEVTAPYKAVVGVTDWSEVRHPVNLPKNPPSD